MRLFPILYALSALIPAACATVPQDTRASTALPPGECAAFSGDRTLLGVTPEAARQGETLTLRAWSPQGPAAPKVIPLDCLTGWAVNPAGAATVSPDGTRLTIAPDAPAGEILTVTATAPGGFAYMTTVLVGRTEIVLTGRWSEIEARCPNGAPAQPLRELEFTSQGEFSVTFMPFETYKDYWGRARFTPDRGLLALSVEGGNNMPSDREMVGEARIDDQGRLVLDSFPLGVGAAAAGPCRYVFRRT